MTQPENIQGGQFENQDEFYWRWHDRLAVVARKFNAKIVGIEHVQAINKTTEGSIIASTHESLWDIVNKTQLGFERPIRFLGRASLKTELPYGLVVRYLGPRARVIFVDRENKESRREAGNEVLQALNHGALSGIYPEGARNRTTDPSWVKDLRPNGVAGNALEADGLTLVLPMAIAYRKLLIAGKVINNPFGCGIVIGEPIEVDHDERPGAKLELNNFLHSQLVDYKAEAVDLAYNRN